MIAGTLFLAPVLALPVLSVAPASGSKVSSVSDFDHDGQLDMQLSDGTVLHGEKQGGFSGNDAKMSATGVAPMTFTLANGTPVPSDRISGTLNTSYMTRTGSGSLLIITPCSENVTVFALDAKGVYHPASTIDFRAASLRELALRPAPEAGPRPMIAPEKNLAKMSGTVGAVRMAPAS